MKKHYTKNTSLMAEMKRYIQTCETDENGRHIKGSGHISEELGMMISRIAKRYAGKGNFSGYTWKEDMIGDAIYTCIKYMHNFNPEKSNNPFAYFTQICHNAFINYIKRQKKHSDIKDICWKNFHMLEEKESEFRNTKKAIDYEILVEKEKI